MTHSLPVLPDAPNGRLCATCLYRQPGWRDGGYYCYFWKEWDRDGCQQWEPASPSHLARFLNASMPAGGAK